MLQKIKSYTKNDNAQPTNVHQRETKINAPMYLSSEGKGSRGETTILKTLLVPSSPIAIQIIANKVIELCVCYSSKFCACSIPQR